MQIPRGTTAVTQGQYIDRVLLAWGDRLICPGNRIVPIGDRREAYTSVFCMPRSTDPLAVRDRWQSAIGALLIELVGGGIRLNAQRFVPIREVPQAPDRFAVDESKKTHIMR